MKTKPLGKYLLCVFAIVMLNITYFIWQPYSKHIIYSPQTGINASDIITNVIYFAVYFVAITVISNFTFSNNIFTRLRGLKTVLPICVLFALQLSFDGIKALTHAFIPDYYFIVNDLCSVIIFTFQFHLIIKLLKAENSEENKKYISLLLFTLAATIFVIFEIMNFIDIASMKNATLKYDNNSVYYSNIVRNYTFSHELRSFIVETVCGILIFSGFFRRYAAHDIIKNDEEAAKPITRVISAILAFGFLIIPILGVAAIKCAILPKSTLDTTSFGGSITSYTSELKLYYDSESITVNRYDNKKEAFVVYDKSTRIFTFNDTTLYKLSVDSSNDFWVDAPDELTKLTDYSYNGVDFKTYANDLIVIENGYYYEFINLKKIKNMDYDKSVVTALEYMISNGAFCYFEYGYEYLLKYDSDFIKPYITDYANGNFTYDALTYPYNKYINSEYIINFAESIEY